MKFIFNHSKLLIGNLHVLFIYIGKFFFICIHKNNHCLITITMAASALKCELGSPAFQCTIACISVNCQLLSSDQYNKTLAS